MARLALAARATASFPGAFEAAVVRSTRPKAFGGELAPAPAPTHGAGARFVDCRGIFSDSRGPASGRPSQTTENDFVVGDGGILDNIPLGRALDAVADAPASGPTRRVLVYLHPTGPPAPPREEAGTQPGSGSHGRSPETRRDVRAVARGVVAARIQSESIDGDLDQLGRHNRAVRVGRMIRRSTYDSVHADPIAGAASQWQSYRIQRPAADAASLRRLLDDPIIVLGDDPFPKRNTQAEDLRWGAPLVAWGDAARIELDAALTTVFSGQLGEGPDETVLLAGLAPLRRTIGLLLEWVRSIKDPDAGGAKAELYTLGSIVAILERARRTGWVTSAACAQPRGRAEVGAWCTDTLAWVDGLATAKATVCHALMTGDADPFRRSVDDALNTKLANASTWPSPEHGQEARVDLRVEVRTAVVDLVDGLLEAGANSSRPTTALLHAVLTATGEPAPTTAERIAALEVLCLPEFMNGAPGRSRITFFRFSAAAETPFAADFKALTRRSQSIDAQGRDGWQTTATFLRPEVKLAGNELGNFSAFLDATWRENDWMWGRLDAAAGLVELLLEPYGGPDATPPPVALYEYAGVEKSVELGRLQQALVRKRQQAILEEELGSTWTTKLAGYRIGLDTVTDPGTAEIRDSLAQLVAVASNVAKVSLPGPLKGIAGPAGRIGRAMVSFYARPRRRVRPEASMRARLAGSADGAETGDNGVGKARRALARLIGVARRALVGLIAIAVGVAVAAIAWGLAANRLSLLIGLGAGLMVGLGLVLLLLLVGWRRPPHPRPRSGP